ncbi:hypothetical protein YC2023_042971 [Brassica napus]
MSVGEEVLHCKIRPMTISTNFKSDPEVVCTVWSTVFMNHDGLSPGDSFLVFHLSCCYKVIYLQSDLMAM